MPKKASLYQSVWAASEHQFDQNSTELLSEPETALERLVGRVGGDRPSTPSDDRVLGLQGRVASCVHPLSCVAQSQTTSQLRLRVIFPET